MKAHVGVCATGDPLVHSVECTAANVHDSQKLEALLHGNENVVYGDKAYADAQKKQRLEDAGLHWKVLAKAKRGTALTDEQEESNRALSSIRAKVEHPFQIVKHLWGHRRARYKGLHKNTCQWIWLLGLSNLCRVRKTLLRMA